MSTPWRRIAAAARTELVNEQRIDRATRATAPLDPPGWQLDHRPGSRVFRWDRRASTPLPGMQVVVKATLRTTDFSWWETARDDVESIPFDVLLTKPSGHCCHAHATLSNSKLRWQSAGFGRRDRNCYPGPNVAELSLPLKNEIAAFFAAAGVTSSFLETAAQQLHYHEHLAYLSWLSSLEDFAAGR